MPRGTTLANLVIMVKAAIGDNATGNTFRDAELKTLLSNEQKLLASSYDFSFLEHRWDLTCPAGSRFLTLPTTTSSVCDTNAAAVINFDRPVIVEVKFNFYWFGLLNGIGGGEYTTFDSDRGIASDPIARWRFMGNINEASPNPNKIEIWPINVTEQVIRWTGQRILYPLLVDSDTADLDDQLLVYSVAVKKAVRAPFIEEAKLLLAQAKAREIQVKGSYPERQSTIIMGQNSGEFYRDDIKIRPLVIVH